jgi:exopolysaccharide biosynthesis polyprenyl glycosylphosphotransferase
MNKRNKRRQVFKYAISDFFAALLAWTLLYIYRKKNIESIKFGIDIPIEFDQSFILGLIVIPFFWILLYYITGEYHNVFRKSRLKELGSTLFISTFGVVIIFFFLILDDVVVTYTDYYSSFLFLLSGHFVLTYFPRLFFTTRTNTNLQNKKIGFPTLIVGSNDQALELLKNLTKTPKSSGYDIIGYVTVNGKNNEELERLVPKLGELDSLIDTINKKNIEEVIIAVSASEREKIQTIITKIKATNVRIKAIPDLVDILAGHARISSLFGVPLIELSHELMPAWQQNVKRIMDVVLSTVALAILFPFFILFSIMVKASSKGPIFYSHYRMGRYGKPFKIYKFRSMYIDAEKNGPALSSKHDPRVTPFGRFMRKVRIDELPQFFNVLKGDMAIVGPRPEREFFITQIVERAPHYFHLLKVRPGITSWGQVKFGYAENVDEMIERLKYDLIYLENMSLYVDIKVMIYTIKTILEASGK